MKKVVQVESVRRKNGWVLPVKVTLENVSFDVENMLFASVSYDGEYEGIRYTVVINKGQEYLYRVGDTWYVMT